jgi:hypothetical protein
MKKPNRELIEFFRILLVTDGIASDVPLAWDISGLAHLREGLPGSGGHGGQSLSWLLGPEGAEGSPG